MASVNLAAFDFVFWTHHCNIDRMYYFWQVLHPSSLPSQSLLNNANGYYALKPFYPRDERQGFPWQNNTGKYASVMEWYDFKTLPYAYSSFPPAPVPKGLSLRARRNYVVLPNLPQPPRTIQIYVFISKDPAAFPEALPSTTGTGKTLLQLLDDNPTCAGVISIFSFNQAMRETNEAASTDATVATAAGSEAGSDFGHTHGEDQVEETEETEETEVPEVPTCQACIDRQAGSRWLDVTDFIRELNVKNISSLHVRAFGVDYLGNDYPLTLAGGDPIVPRLILENDLLFSEQLHDESEASDWDLSRVDYYLKVFGFKSSKTEPREDSLRKLQSFYGLAETGALDAATIALLSKSRAGNKDIDEPTIYFIADQISKGKTEFKYCVTNLDFELQYDSEASYAAIQECFDIWTRALNEKSEKLKEANKQVTFTRVEGGVYDVSISFAAVDGKLKTLGYTSLNQRGFVTIILDSDEEWVLDDSVKSGNGSSSQSQSQSLKAVLIHELGHLFGLSHQQESTSVMNPFIQEESHPNVPSDEDINRIIELL